ncbi:MAG: response regulator transcription factor [Geodermatophilaceae bacterium]
MIRLLIADDQPLVRMGLRVLAEAEEDIELVGEAGDGAEALRLARERRPDIILMDIRMPGTDGITALRAITADPQLAGVRVVMLTTFELDEYVFDALAAGASGFLVKDGDTAELLHALRVVASGESLLSRLSPAASSPSSPAARTAAGRTRRSIPSPNARPR